MKDGRKLYYDTLSKIVSFRISSLGILPAEVHNYENGEMLRVGCHPVALFAVGTGGMI